MDYKEKVLQVYEEKKQEKIKWYDVMISQVSKMSSYIDVFSSLVEVYGNNMEQKDVGIALLSDNLDKNFVENFTPGKRVNYISFQNEEYEVLFETSRINGIIIIDKQAVKKPFKTNEVRQETLDYQKILQTYINNPTLKNKKPLVDRYFNKHGGNKIQKFTTLLTKTYTKHDLKQVNSSIKSSIQGSTSYQENFKLFNERNDKSLLFVNSLEFLNDFGKKNFHISLVGIHNHDKYETKTNW